MAGGIFLVFLVSRHHLHDLMIFPRKEVSKHSGCLDFFWLQSRGQYNRPAIVVSGAYAPESYMTVTRADSVLKWLPPSEHSTVPVASLLKLTWQASPAGAHLDPAGDSGQWPFGVTLRMPGKAPPWGLTFFCTCFQRSPTFQMSTL